MGTVAAPIGSDQVEFAIAVEVPRRDARPPPAPVSEPPPLGDFLERAAAIGKYANWTPFTRQQQFRVTILVQVAPARAADQPNAFQTRAVGRVQRPSPRGFLAINP